VSSFYFEELLERYRDEIDDLRSDSQGLDVLGKRLADKRSQFAALLAMKDDAPEMVACALHGAFRFRDEADVDAASQSEPGEPEFPGWAALAESVDVAPWAATLVEASLAEDGGDAFLVNAAVLEWLVSKNAPGRWAELPQDDGQDEEQDLSEAGEAFLSAQGFDDLNR